MGCGASNNVVPAEETANGHGKANGNGVGNGHEHSDHNGHNGHHEDSLPTVVLPETPVKPKPPIAFEIPLEEFEGGKRPSSPPAHLQRLLQPPQAEISLPHIEEKLAEAEQRRQSILQQRAASAQKRTQKILKAVLDLDRSENHSNMENIKHGANALTIPPDPGAWEDKNITKISYTYL